MTAPLPTLTECQQRILAMHEAKLEARANRDPETVEVCDLEIDDLIEQWQRLQAQAQP